MATFPCQLQSNINTPQLSQIKEKFLRLSLNFASHQPLPSRSNLLAKALPNEFLEVLMVPFNWAKPKWAAPSMGPRQKLLSRDIGLRGSWDEPKLERSISKRLMGSAQLNWKWMKLSNKLR